MKRIIPIVVIALIAAGCGEKMQEPAPGKCIGRMYVTSTPGSRPVLVKLDGLWRVRPCSDWITTDVNGREGQGAFTLSYASNESDFVQSNPTRRGAVVIQSLSTMKADTLYVLQQGIPDGNEYDSLPQDSYIEFPEGQLQTVSVLYANVQGAGEEDAAEWISATGADINCIISDSGITISRKDGAEVEILGSLTAPRALFAKTQGLNLAVADFGAALPEGDNYYDYTVRLLSGSYDRPDAEPNWLVGGSLYYLSAMEAGYASTPSWYPEDPSDILFAADRYAQGANLTDTVWMTARDYTPTWSSEGRSWRADYLYASHSVWNAATSVKVLESSPAGAAHKAILIKIKF